MALVSVCPGRLPPMCAGDVVVAVDGKKARGEAATALLQQGAAKSTRRLRVRRQEARAPERLGRGSGGGWCKRTFEV